MGVLRRKFGRVEAGTAQGAEGAWHLSLARAARDATGLSPEVTAGRETRVSLAELVEHLADRSLIAMLDEGEGAALGLCALAPPLLSGLVALLTTGRAPLDPETPRRPTRTDAAMLAPLIDAALSGWAAELAAQEDGAFADGWRYASFLEDARPLALLLEDTAYRLFRADLSLPQGGVAGQVLLALPAAPRPRRSPQPAQMAAQADAALADAAQADGFRTAFSRQVETVACRMDAELVRITLPLGQVMALAVGDVVPLADATVARLLLRGVDGQTIAEGKLGQMRGQRAVRLSLPADPAPLPAPQIAG